MDLEQAKEILCKFFYLLCKKQVFDSDSSCQVTEKKHFNFVSTFNKTDV